MRAGMWWRHLLVVLSVAVLVGLTLFGLAGTSAGRERIVGYQVVAQVQADGSVRIREVIDWEFGPLAFGKHGIYRDIPIGMAGAPTDVVVSSPDAPDDVLATTEGADRRLRIGDPDVTVSGRHRYEITYSLPRAVRGGRVALDLVGTAWNVPIEGIDARIIGADLSDVRCFQGEQGSTRTCAVEEVPGGLRAEVTSVGAHNGVTVEGRVESVTPAELPEVAPMAERDPEASRRWAVVVGVIGLLTGAAVFVAFRRAGSNEVLGDGAIEAAFGPGGVFAPDGGFGPPGPTRMVADARMGELAGLDFAPPRGVEPWQGAAVLREAIDERTVGAWFASLAAHDIVRFTAQEVGSGVRLVPGAAAAQADATAAPILNRALAGRPWIDLVGYDEPFAGAWKEARRAIGAWVRSSGVFRRRPPSGSVHVSDGGRVVVGVFGVAVPIAFTLVLVCISVPVLAGPATVAMAVLVPGAVAVAVYWKLLRSLSWKGSAIALRTESFRRFLHDSEGHHVEWAWRNGLLREYSAWAVALDEADAWHDALARAGVPPDEVAYNTAVMAPAIHASSFSSTHTAPSSSGGDGGGGFSGGGDGGGGGGSW